MQLGRWAGNGHASRFALVGTLPCALCKTRAQPCNPTAAETFKLPLPFGLQDAYSMRLTFPEGEKAAAEKAAAAAKQQQQGSGDKPAAAGAPRKAGKRR